MNGGEADRDKGNYTVTLIPGDGIGPEIANSVKDIFKAAKVGWLPSFMRRPPSSALGPKAYTAACRL